ncbi:TetR/AcrR family transcriptional regulator [Crystallibacter crystallopoietes]|nr:TetR/AcrR family transcriptional regulator [Arthrobacter crystallopoietes]
MAGTPRERAREQTMGDIVRIGRSHLASQGAAALSLRAVARDLGVVSSAVYRYVKSRDELLTLLVVDAYGELGDAVDQAVAAVPADDFAEQFRALGRAVRGWGLREPARYALLFGSPVPGYQAPAERTTGPGTRVVLALVAIAERAWQADSLVLPVGRPEPEGLARDLEAIRGEFGLKAPAAVVSRWVQLWASLFGAVSFEVFGQYGPDTFSRPEELFEGQLQVLVELAGLAPNRS